MSDRDNSIAEEVAAIAKEVGKTPAQGTSSNIYTNINQYRYIYK